MEDKRHGIIDNWLRYIQDTASLYDNVLAAIDGNEARFDKLCELNVIEQVINTCETTIVQDAWARGQELTIHGWVYGLKDGLARDLDISVDRPMDRKELRFRFLTNGVTNS